MIRNSRETSASPPKEKLPTISGSRSGSCATMPPWPKRIAPVDVFGLWTTISVGFDGTFVVIDFRDRRAPSGNFNHISVRGFDTSASGRGEATAKRKLPRLNWLL